MLLRRRRACFILLLRHAALRRRRRFVDTRHFRFYAFDTRRYADADAFDTLISFICRVAAAYATLLL